MSEGDVTNPGRLSVPPSVKHSSGIIGLQRRNAIPFNIAMWRAADL